MADPFTLIREPVWKPVVGLEGLYEVSDTGQVRSLDRLLPQRVGKGNDPDRLVEKFHPGKVLTPRLSSAGYLHVHLRGKTYQVHALVLRAFIGPCPPGMLCRHRDSDKTNNRLGNLVWGTSLENWEDADALGRIWRGQDYPWAKLTDSSVREIRSLRHQLSQSALARKFNVSPAAIQAVMDGRTWKHVR